MRKNLLLGKKWHARRKITAPAFHFKMVEKFTETFDRLGNSYIAKLSEYCANGEDIDFYSLNKLHSLNVVCGKMAALNGFLCIKV